MKSLPIKFQRQVRTRFGTTKDETFSVGCHCHIPTAPLGTGKPLIDDLFLLLDAEL